MAKKRKTRDQKIITQLRHKLTSQQTNEGTISPAPHVAEKFTYTIPTISSPGVVQQKIVDVGYLKKDLLKTVILSAGIVFVELLVYVSLSWHVIHIATLQY